MIDFLKALFKPTSAKTNKNDYDGVVVEQRETAGQTWRIREVNRNPTIRPAVSGYEVDRKTLGGWKDQGVLLGDESSLEDFFDRKRRERREENCMHPEWKDTAVGVGGEMVRGEKCTECGKLNLNW